MNGALRDSIAEAKEAALTVLLHNWRGPHGGLPRAAGWGYPEPYTRDLMIASLGVFASGNEELLDGLRAVLESAARNQTRRGHIPSLVDDPEDRGASDTTPLFLLATAVYRRVTGKARFLDPALRKALTWMEYQSPPDRTIVAQLPTSDWRDEHWVLGFGLYVNAIVHGYLTLLGQDERARQLRDLMNVFVVQDDAQKRHVPEGLAVPRKPYYALWSYKIYSNDRFDLLGNSMAILTGLTSPERARSIIRWVEKECVRLRASGQLAVDLPPCLFPYMTPDDPDWRPRYARYNLAGEYHNGGVWPFACGLYVAAAVAAGLPAVAERKLAALTRLVRPIAGPPSRRDSDGKRRRDSGEAAPFGRAALPVPGSDDRTRSRGASRVVDLTFGFNEWIKAQDGTPRGQDWQTWSAALYLYAARCVEEGRALYLNEG